MPSRPPRRAPEPRRASRGRAPAAASTARAQPSHWRATRSRQTSSSTSSSSKLVVRLRRAASRRAASSRRSLGSSSPVSAARSSSPGPMPAISQSTGADTAGRHRRRGRSTAYNSPWTNPAGRARSRSVSSAARRAATVTAGSGESALARAIHVPMYSGVAANEMLRFGVLESAVHVGEPRATRAPRSRDADLLELVASTRSTRSQ